jgi:hypothetical protein
MDGCTASCFGWLPAQDEHARAIVTEQVPRRMLANGDLAAFLFMAGEADKVLLHRLGAAYILHDVTPKGRL